MRCRLDCERDGGPALPPPPHAKAEHKIPRAERDGACTKHDE